MDRLQILVAFPEGVHLADLVAAARAGLFEASHREGVERLVAWLPDAEAGGVPAGDLARPPSFHAVVGFAGEAAGREAVLEVAGELGRCHVYRVEERVLREHPREPGGGGRTAGVVMVSGVHRAAPLGPWAFDEHWRERHAPLALRHHPGMWDYRQLPVRAVLSAGSPAFDGFALMGFPSREAFETGLFDSAEGQRLIIEDTDRFLALDISETAMLGEYWLRGGIG